LILTIDAKFLQRGYQLPSLKYGTTSFGLINIFKETELDEKSVCALFAHTAGDAKTYQIKRYNLDVIISVDYRVNSFQATHLKNIFSDGELLE